MTYEEVVEAALSRTLEWDGEFPSTRLPMYRRIGTRQQQLFTKGSKVNPTYYGVKAGAALDANRELDLRDMAGVPAVNQAVGVQRVEIGDPGTSTWVAGDRVAIVDVDDIEADLAPRVTLRDFVLKAVGTDLDLVTSLCVYYPRYPDMPANTEDGTTDVEMSETFSEMLVIDLTKYLLRKTLGIESGVKTAMMAALAEEEGEEMAVYVMDIAAFGIGQSHRFSEPQPGDVTR